MVNRSAVYLAADEIGALKTTEEDERQEDWLAFFERCFSRGNSGVFGHNIRGVRNRRWGGGKWGARASKLFRKSTLNGYIKIT